MDMQFPALNGGVVTEAITRYCAVNGHAKHTVDGVDTGTCPRCGEVTIPAAIHVSCPHGYGIDPMDQCPWCTGEETVNEMTNTGDATDNVRDVFPRVTFRDVEDAEMVAESLRKSCVEYGKRAAQALKVWGLSAAANKIAFVEVIVLDGNGDPANAYETVQQLIKTENRMLGMLDATIAQLAQMYGTPTPDNAKYISDLLEFVTETTEFTDAVAMAAEEMNKKSGEQ